MNRFAVLALFASISLGACSDNKTTTAAATPGSAQTAPPAVAAPPVALPPLPSGASPTATARDSPATDPKGTLTKEEEAKAMPMAGHGNNHSSPSLESSSPK